jgi:hypothetical protein
MPRCRSSVQGWQKSPAAGVPRESPRVSLSKQGMLMVVSEHFFWYVRRVLKGSRGKARYQKTTSTGRQSKRGNERYF